MKNVIVIFVLSMAMSVSGQTTPETAREILGSKFIEFDEASLSWGAITSRYFNNDMPIPFSRDTLLKCAAKNSQGKADYYLVPILGVTNDELLSFWRIESNCLPLQTTVAGWRLINFFDDKDLYFSWEEEQKQASKRGVKILSAPDYLEAVATISLTRDEEKTSNFTKFYFSPRIWNDIRYKEFLPNDVAIVYSADIRQREALVLYFPKENFVPISVRPDEFSFVIFGQDQNDAVVFEFKKGLRSFTGEIQYDISVLDTK